jgi:hypothetical protein
MYIYMYALLLLLLLLFQREDIFITHILKYWNKVNRIGICVCTPSTLNPLSHVSHVRGFVCFITSCYRACRLMRQYNFRKVFVCNPTFFIVIAIFRDYSNVAGRLKGH